MKISTYARCSTDMQDSQSQAFVINEYCEREFPGEKVNTYADDAVSGARRDRVELIRAMESLGIPEPPKRGHRDTERRVLVVSELSRLARDKDLLLYIVATAGLLNIEIKCVNNDSEVDQGTITGWMMHMMTTVFSAAKDEQERKDIAKRIGNGVRNAIANGRKDNPEDKTWGGQRAPIGKKGGLKFTPEEDEKIRADREAGMSWGKLEKKWGATKPTIKKAVDRASEALSGGVASEAPETPAEGDLSETTTDTPEATETQEEGSTAPVGRVDEDGKVVYTPSPCFVVSEEEYAQVGDRGPQILRDRKVGVRIQDLAIKYGLHSKIIKEALKREGLENDRKMHLERVMETDRQEAERRAEIEAGEVEVFDGD